MSERVRDALSRDAGEGLENLFAMMRPGNEVSPYQKQIFRDQTAQCEVMVCPPGLVKMALHLGVGTCKADTRLCIGIFVFMLLICLVCLVPV